MKMNKTSLIILTIVIVALLSGGFFLVTYEVYQNQQEAEQVAEEGTQIDEVLLHGALGAALDDGLEAGEFPHNGGEFGYADLVAHGRVTSFPLVFSAHYYTKSFPAKSGQTVNFAGFAPFITVLSQLIAIW